jgi:8-oxo-dGTP diphosphatase
MGCENLESFAISVKAFIVKGNRLLILKRIKGEVHYADKWDIPGGRLLQGENPFVGVKREAKEETGLDIDILLPFALDHFVRDDGQKITMIIFLCRPLSNDVVLSDAHTEYRWFDLASLDGLQDWLVPIVKEFLKYRLGSFV